MILSFIELINVKLFEYMSMPESHVSSDDDGGVEKPVLGADVEPVGKRIRDSSSDDCMILSALVVQSWTKGQRRKRRGGRKEKMCARATYHHSKCYSLKLDQYQTFWVSCYSNRP